ncbi:hypothetical protein [Mesorhizobium sp. LNJC405B00]|uniref:hypothetical protein n=1 Tax=Mesorhizobium sp. LNJC405B00 TaxID=1287281 RepID=UPI00067F0009|nr:hypothetical protein [Mesorhizobium sp. LNJC405B00]
MRAVASGSNGGVGDLRTIGRFLLLAVVLCLGPSPARAVTLDSSVAVTDPETLQALERGGLSISRLLGPALGLTREVDNRGLFSVRALTPVRNAVKQEIADEPANSPDPYVAAMAKSKDTSQKFNPKYIDDDGSTLDLTGVVNRMDRGYLGHTECGEIRLIYRFHYSVAEKPANGKTAQRISSRLPLTMSLVFNARPGEAHARASRDRPSATAVSCAEIAKRWLAAGQKNLAPEQLAAWLRSDEGPLSNAMLNSSQIMRLELNMQVLRLSASSRRDFGGHAEYLLKIFKWDPTTSTFQESKMENQIDRKVVLADRPAFAKWLLTDRNLYDLDRGRLVIDDKFLATSAVSVAPGGMARSQNNIAYGLLDDADIDKALQDYVAKGNELRSVKSVAGFNLRLNEMTCTGCHQTHGIAGFHYTGADPASEPRRNAVFVPGSAVFFADLPRRRAIVEDFAAGGHPDFSRGFAARPDAKLAEALKGTDLYNGWGSICYSGKDASFKDWNCGESLRCAGVHESDIHPGFGTCVSEAATAVGDPVEFGEIKMSSWGSDKYCRLSPATAKACAIDPARDKKPVIKLAGYGAARQRYDNPEQKTGGFPGGMLRKASCDKLPDEATCGRLAKTGFNDCVASGKDHKFCTKEFTKTAGLRACDKAHPCREDYICTAGYDDLAAAKPGKGSCIPPYFIFQFRVDGHPRSWVQDTEE